MNQKYIVIANDNFSQPMSREEAIRTVKDYDSKGILGYIVSEKEAERMKDTENFNEPKWE